MIGWVFAAMGWALAGLGVLTIRSMDREIAKLCRKEVRDERS